MARGDKRRAEEQIRHLLQRGLEAYRRRIRQRASAILREFLQTQRLPKKLMLRDVQDIVEAVFGRRHRVPWLYRYLAEKKPWLARKWAWYLRNKTYWREKLEVLARELQLYRRYGDLIRKGDIYYALALMSAWADSYELTENELCTAVHALGPLGAATPYFRRITVYGSFSRFARYIKRLWPRRTYRVIIVLKDRSRTAEREADKGGEYIRDFGMGRKRYWIYSFRVLGKELPELVRQFEDELEVLQIWTLDPVPSSAQCR